MHDENDEEEEGAEFSSSNKQIKKERKMRLLLEKKVKILKSKFPSSLERIFYMNLIK
jgi:hypothetical protein